MASTYELLARDRKAGRLAMALLAAKIPAEDVRGMDEAEWAMAAQKAGCHVPSAVTRGLVIQKLSEVDHAHA